MLPTHSCPPAWKKFAMKPKDIAGTLPRRNRHRNHRRRLIVEMLEGREMLAGLTASIDNFSTPNLALQSVAGSVAFAKDVIPLPEPSPHTIAHLNDGLYGNANSWIGNSSPSFAGINFGSLKTIGGVAWGRDNTGVYSDRSKGKYTLEFTTDDPISVTANWTLIGDVTYESASPLRQKYTFAAVDATGIRLRTEASDLIAIDELEVYAPQSTQATLASISVTPANPSFSAGSTLQLTATGNYSDGSTKIITSEVSWQSLATSVATIDVTGLATGVSGGPRPSRQRLMK